MPNLPVEISMELLTDVETALSHILSQLLPTSQFKIRRKVTDDSVELTLTLYSDIYPRFVKVTKRDMMPLRPTNYGRRLLGLPEREFP